MGVGAGLYMYVVIVQKFTFAISSPDEFLFFQEDSALVHCAYSTVQLLQCSPPIQHLSEKCDFRVFPFCQVVQKHKLFEVTLEHLLIADCVGNISAKKYQNLFICLKVIASHT